MKIELKGREHKPGSGYAFVFSLAIMIIEVCFVVNTGIELSKNSPAAIAFSCSFIILFLIFSFVGKKLFDLTEKLYMRSGDSDKAYNKAVLTEILVFFVGIAFIFIFVTKII